MAATDRPTTSGLKLPGAGTPELLYVCQAWGVRDAANAIPHHLHPHNEHCANNWSKRFQFVLQGIAKITRREELEEIQHTLQGTVHARLRNGRGKTSKVPFLNAEDLKHVKDVFGYKRDSERREREASLAAAAALAVADCPPIKEEEHEENARAEYPPIKEEEQEDNARADAAIATVECP